METRSALTPQIDFSECTYVLEGTLVKDEKLCPTVTI